MPDNGTALAPSPIGVKQIDTDLLHANPYNPRTLFDNAPMKTLEESISKVGILVPLTIYHRVSDGKFIILDGQRRWICAQKLALKAVPVNQVAEPNIVQNIVTMFQIHKLREDWELMPTALKLELLRNELKLDQKSERKLAELTGLDIAMVTRCRKLLSYDKEFQDLMLVPNPEKRVRTDFFIELYPFLHDRVVKSVIKHKPKVITRKMLAKYQNPRGGIKAVTDFRKVKQHIANGRNAGKLHALSRKLIEFVEELELKPDHLIIPAVDVTTRARTLRKKVEVIHEELTDLDIETVISEEEFWKALEMLFKVIRKCLIKADRRVKE